MLLAGIAGAVSFLVWLAVAIVVVALLVLAVRWLLGVFAPPPR